MAFQRSKSKDPNREASFLLEDESDQLLTKAVIRLSGHVLGVVLGLLAALGIFVVTNFLILKGGEVVGPHLSLLRVFLPFYSVTFLGSLIGSVYGFVCGYIAGFIIATLYNLVVTLKNR